MVVWCEEVLSELDIYLLSFEEETHVTDSIFYLLYVPKNIYSSSIYNKSEFLLA
jgi:hypothetical protein